VGVKAASASVSAKFGVSDLPSVLFILHGFREISARKTTLFLKA
jgi:hypothetical protein